MASELGTSAGATRYEAQLHFISKEIYGEPDRTFRLRMIILLCITVYNTTLSFIYTASVVEQALKRNGGSGLWLWRKVHLGGSIPSRDEPHLIVMNSKLVLCFGISIQAIYIVFYLVDGFHAYINHADQTLQYPLRAFLPMPIFIVGWILSCSILQALLLLHTHEQRQRKWAPRLNSLFICGGIFWLAIYLIGAVSGSVTGIRYWRDNVSFSAELVQLQATIKGVAIDSNRLSWLERRTSEYTSKRRLYRICAQVLYGSLPFYAATIFVLNFSTLLLARFVRDRVEHQMSDFSFSGVVRAHSWERGQAPLAPLQRCIIRHENTISRRKDKALSGLGHGHLNYLDLESSTDNSFTSTFTQVHWRPGRNNSTRETDFHLPSHADLGEDGADSPTGEGNVDARRLQAIQLLELDATRRFLSLIGGLIATCATICFVIAMYVTVTFESAFFTNWARFESVVYGYPWLIGAFGVIALTLLLRFQLRARKLWLARKASSLVIFQQVQVAVENS